MTISFITSFIFIAAVITYLFLQLLLTFSLYKQQNFIYTLESQNLPFSVIVAAHNEAHNLKQYLPMLLQQIMRKYEVIIALDRCSDDSEEIIKTLQLQHKNLFYVKIEEVPNEWSPKKYALTQAIKQAKYPHLAFTDADCEVGKYWLQNYSAAFVNTGAEIVLGLGYYYEKPTLLNQFIRFETFYTAFQYVGFCRLGMPYMGVGRNIAYQKSFFEQRGGFEAFKSHLSGDDDLFVNAYAHKNNTIALINEENITFTEAKNTFKTWLRQKFRHVSASNAYSWQTKLFLTLFHFSHLAIYTFALLNLLVCSQTLWIILIFLVRLLVSWSLFAQANRLLQVKKMLYLYPVFDILYYFYNACVVPIGLIKKPTWI